MTELPTELSDDGASFVNALGPVGHRAPPCPRIYSASAGRFSRQSTAAIATDLLHPDAIDPVKAAWRHIRRGWDATLALQFVDAWGQLTAAEWAIVGLPFRTAAPLVREVDLLRAAIYVFRDNSVAGLAAAVQMAALDGTPAAVAKTICRFAYWKMRDFEALQGLRPASRPQTRRLRAVLPAVLDRSIEAAVALEQLRLPIAKRLAHDALALSEAALDPSSAVAALPASIAAQLAYEEGRVDEAEQLIGDRLSAVRARGDIECAIRTFAVLARVAVYRGEGDIAERILADAGELAERRGWPRLLAASLLERIEIMLARGQLDEAKLSVTRLELLAGNPGPGDHLSHREIQRYAMIGRARVERTIDPNLLLSAMFRRLRQEALSRRHLFEAVQLSVWLADSLAATGQIDEALDTLAEALKTGATVGLYRVFLDGGEPVRELLQLFRERSRASSHGGELTLYVCSLLSNGPLEAPTARAKVASTWLGVRISERERTIVQLIAAGLPNKRIAQTLGITPETVKSHIRNVFPKLSASTRTEAVRRAQTLGLI